MLSFVPFSWNRLSWKAAQIGRCDSLFETRNIDLKTLNLNCFVFVVTKEKKYKLIPLHSQKSFDVMLRCHLTTTNWSNAPDANRYNFAEQKLIDWCEQNHQLLISYVEQGESGVSKQIERGINAAESASSGVVLIENQLSYWLYFECSIFLFTLTNLWYSKRDRLRLDKTIKNQYRKT